MTYIANNPESYSGKVVGTGQCVAYVQEASGAPNTSLWTKGGLVKGESTLPKGTAIATFSSEGKYTNSLDGTSHAAIYISQDAVGIKVWDQWKGQPVHQRTIRFQGGAAGTKPVNDGDYFYVIN
jgi:hypothetical protein